MFSPYGRLVRVVQYGSSYRSVEQEVESGKVIIYGGNTKTIVKIEDNLVKEHKRLVNGKFTYWIKYGEFEKARENGTTYSITHYRQKTGRGLHGLTIRKDIELLGHKGTCYTFYSRGKFLWQKFVYPNRRVAYYVRWTHTEVKAIQPDKKPLFEIKVNSLFTKENRDAVPFIYRTHRDAQPYNYSADGIYCEYTFWDKKGRIKEQGKYEHNQRVGEWIEKYRPYFYLSGLPVPKDLYYKEPKDIPAEQVLKLGNAQVRAMFLKKIGYERVVKECEGKVIDKFQNYDLIDFPVKFEKADLEADKVLRILKVVCPSTKQNKFLKVPSTDDFKTCLKARNGTFTSFEPQAKMVEFAVET